MASHWRLKINARNAGWSPSRPSARHWRHSWPTQRWADGRIPLVTTFIGRDLLPAYRTCLLTGIQAEDLWTFCIKIKERGATATAVHIRDIVKQVYLYAIAHVEKVDKPC
ncbi:hypothetical protein [Pseudomonas sp. URMO17WK12:I12]|uniref:phage integrase central domain-containing protein n=1 Tax=Pseudomonas sp. URMO17WK12:I12 TaxID=1259797 RepID=UPI0035292991